jgi:hypothetical protein
MQQSRLDSVLIAPAAIALVLIVLPTDPSLAALVGSMPEVKPLQVHSSAIAPSNPSGYRLADATDCRRVLYDLPVYVDPDPNSVIPAYTLYSGNRVSLIKGNIPVLGTDKRSYLYVSFPYADPNASRGYIQTQITLSNGQPASTVGYCQQGNGTVPARW